MQKMYLTALSLHFAVIAVFLNDQVSDGNVNVNVHKFKIFDSIISEQGIYST